MGTDLDRGVPPLRFTTAQLAAYVESDAQRCPFCQSMRIQADAFDTDADGAWQDVRCHACGGTWQDIYSRTHLAYGHEGGDAQQIAVVTERGIEPIELVPA